MGEYQKQNNIQILDLKKLLPFLHNSPRSVLCLIYFTNHILHLFFLHDDSEVKVIKRAKKNRTTYYVLLCLQSMILYFFHGAINMYGVFVLKGYFRNYMLFASTNKIVGHIFNFYYILKGSSTVKASF